MIIFQIVVLRTMHIAQRIFVSRGKLKIWHVIRLKCVRRNCVIVFLKRLLGRRFSFRSLGRREEQEMRKTERESVRVGDERAGNRKEIQVSFQHRFRSAAKRFCEFELKFHQATTPLLFLAIIVPHRIHVALFFLPSAPSSSFRCKYSAGKTNSWQTSRRETTSSRVSTQPVKMRRRRRLRRQKRDVTRRYAARFPRHFVASCVFGMEFILFITVASPWAPRRAIFFRYAYSSCWK